METPDSYQGREQTQLKHRVLDEYVTSWGHKLGSQVRQGRRVRLWYVDCFAGPWRQQDEQLNDTSVAIGLQALNTASETWRSQGYPFDVSAIFVEKDDDAFKRLEGLVDDRKGIVAPTTLHGAFEDHVSTIKAKLGDDPALLFVDPTGWKGAAMRNIAPLANGRSRDVLVNVMFNFINRFKDDQRPFLRQQMMDFFGLDAEDIPANLDEAGLMKFYREQLKKKCGISFAADMAIPHPTQERTWFRLVVGGKHPKVLELFRQVEQKVVGKEAGAVRDEAKKHKRESESSQVELALLGAPAVDRAYAVLHDQGRANAGTDILARLQAASAIGFGELWPSLLEEHHITLTDARRIVVELHNLKRLVISGLKPRERTPKDHHVLTRA